MDISVYRSPVCSDPRSTVIPVGRESGRTTDHPDMCIENRQLVYPKYANNLGTIHCGCVMVWMDRG